MKTVFFNGRKITDKLDYYRELLKDHPKYKDNQEHLEIDIQKNKQLVLLNKR